MFPDRPDNCQRLGKGAGVAPPIDSSILRESSNFEESVVSGFGLDLGLADGNALGEALGRGWAAAFVSAPSESESELAISSKLSLKTPVDSVASELPSLVCL